MNPATPVAASDDGTGSVIALYVQPRASRTEVTGLHDGAVRLRIAAPPVDGKANAEIITFLTKRLDVAKSSVRIISGDSGRRKLVLVVGLTPAEVASRLLH